MTSENGVRIVAGCMVLLSIALTLWVSTWWLCLTAFVGVNLIQSAFTHFCPAEMLLKKAGLPSCSAGSSRRAAEIAER